MSRILKIDTDTVKLIDELREIRTRSKTDGKREDEICELLKTQADNQPASLQFRHQILAAVEEGTSSRLDATGLRAAHPEIAKEFTKSLVFLRVKLC
jgi:hypothetical protein